MLHKNRPLTYVRGRLLFKVGYIGQAVPDLDYDLAMKGHEVARTMMAVEALYPGRLKTSLR
jgi:hypothetical protein